MIVLFAKAPRPGQVKTRLGVDPSRAAELHSSFVRQTLVMLETLRGDADVELSTDEATEDWREFLGEHYRSVISRTCEEALADSFTPPH